MPTPHLRFTRIAIAIILSLPVYAAAGQGGAPQLRLEVAAGYQSRVFDQGASEIVAYDPHSRRLFVTNGNTGNIDVLDASVVDPDDDVEELPLLSEVDLHAYWAESGGANSVAVKNGVVAAAVENADKTLPGRVMMFDTVGQPICQAEVGALPDMITFTPDGRYALVANEGEPDGNVDPEGSISIVDQACAVRTVDFHSFDGKQAMLRGMGVRLFPDVGTRITVSQDLEPEYIAVSPDGRTAHVTLQEANALAIVDIRHARVTEILPLGLKRHALPYNALDVSDKDDAIDIRTWPVYGMYMPDAIASYKVGRATYYVTANEGDDRGDAGGDEAEERGDVSRLKDIDEVTSFGRSGLELSDRLAARLDNTDGGTDKDRLGRVSISTVDGIDEDGKLDRLHVYGGRSFSIWDERGRQVYDSGSQFERITAELAPGHFNSTNDDNDSLDNRSDNKGPEPEAIAIGEIDGRSYAFIGLERVGGIMVYDISNPRHPEHVFYINYRDFSVDAEDGTVDGTAGDLGPEGLVFIPAHQSPEPGVPMLALASEISGTTTLYRVVTRRGHGHHGDRRERHGRDHRD